MRIAYILISIVAVLATPFWLYLPVIFIGLVIFPQFFEAIPLAFLVDSLYGSLFFGPIAVVLAIVLQPLRKYLRFDV